ncbi:MAG TPA: GerMN domain-containing protein [Candidatus Eisenbacteria bacterium]|jgi:spore germination protein GerM
MRRRYVILAVAAIVVFAASLISSQRNRARAPLGPGRLLPLAADLEGTRGVYLYFAVPGTDSLVAEYRDVVVKDRPADQVRAVYRELLAGPMGRLAPLFPEGTELLSAYLTDRGTLYLDWNRALVSGFRGGTGRERLLLSSIVRTAHENFPGVEQVAILVEGDPVETVGGHFDALLPLVVRDSR